MIPWRSPSLYRSHLCVNQLFAGRNDGQKLHRSSSHLWPYWISQWIPQLRLDRSRPIPQTSVEAFLDRAAHTHKHINSSIQIQKPWRNLRIARSRRRMEGRRGEERILPKPLNRRREGKGFGRNYRDNKERRERRDEKNKEIVEMDGWELFFDFQRCYFGKKQRNWWMRIRGKMNFRNDY